MFWFGLTNEVLLQLNQKPYMAIWPNNPTNTVCGPIQVILHTVKSRAEARLD